jgi:CHAT domain-containing protein
MDYVVSSYSPTVTALTNRVIQDRPINEEAARLFVTSQPKAPGTAPIPGTTKEVESIYNQAIRHKINALRLEGDAVSAEGCLTYMEGYSGIHFACHASQNAARPLRSRFLFHEGHLDLGTIMQRDLKNADLAFLSACQTSTGEETLSDEAVHLAAGMLAAGYRRVVATMWAIGDQHAPQVAEDFYQYLWSHREEGIGSRFDGTLSAYALHHATQQLRKRLDNSDKSLLAWIPYVHFGY